MGRRSIFAAGLLAAAATASPFPRLDTSKRQEDKSAPTFSHIEPSAELKWVDCFKEKWRCAYLTVPLDYANTSAGTIDVAFVKYLYSEDAEDVIFNPGGPSEPGVNSLTSETNGASYGQEWSEKWGVNMVSFDPRGVGWTGPDVSCTPANGTKLERRDELQTAMEKAYGEMLKTNRACSEANKDTDAKYIGTSAVVQDLMHFTELSAALKGKDPKTAGINYFGVSYGTVIGQTLAQMYPDRIRRVLLDANVNSVTYYQGWNPDCLDDLAHAFWMFSHICHKAGSEWCALTEGKRSTEEVLDRIEDAMAALDKEPIAITFKGQELPISKTYFVQALRQFLYYPRAHFNDIANITLAAETRNVPVFEDLLAKGIPALAKGGNVKRETPNPSGDEQRIINAVDIAGRYPWKNFEDYYAAVKRIKAPYASESFATGNGMIGLAMDAFVPPPSQFVEEFKFVNTSVPILFVNTPADPVTPRSGVHQMWPLFGGSSYFIQNSPGHSYTGSKSKCSDDIILAYWKDAKLPEPDTWCEPDVEAKWYFDVKE